MPIQAVYCLTIDPDNEPLGNIFQLNVETDTTIPILKIKIREAQPTKHKDIDANDLKIWRYKERKLHASQHITEQITEILNKRNLYDNAYQPFSTTKVGDLGLDDEILLVRTPKKPQKRRTSPPLANTCSAHHAKTLTVEALYRRLFEYHFVLVRGTPASGKSTLAELLREHVSKNASYNIVIIGHWWDRDTRGDWLSHLRASDYDSGIPNVVIIDEAQLSYWDIDFWNQYLKAISPSSRDYVILFVSYGSPGGRPSAEGTSMRIPPRQHISLRAIDHGDGVPPAGLLLSEDEFRDMVHKSFAAEWLAEDFLQHVYRVTAGHAGAVYDFLRVILDHNSYRQIKRTNGRYSLEVFRREISLKDFWSLLSIEGRLGRGLPLLSELQKPDFAQVFRAVLTNNHVTMDMFDDVDGGKAALETCFKNGWLHAARPSPETEDQYMFTTPLHQSFVEYWLGIRISDPNIIKESTLLDFAIEVIQKFSHQQLSSPRHLGASGLQRPPEGQYQDEFYRCCYLRSEGSLITFSEFGGVNGRIDFYIPCKHWGVELLRDGDRLEGHSSRFTGSGAYASMSFDDYIILDFRKNQPQLAHPEIKKLYHVVFSGDCRSVKLLAGLNLSMITEFELLS